MLFCIRSGYKVNKFKEFYFQVYVHNKVEREACALPAQYYKHSNIIIFFGTSIDFNYTAGKLPFAVASGSSDFNAFGCKVNQFKNVYLLKG